MPDDRVIELSTEETNKLRLSLGLAPLRAGASSISNHDHQAHNHTAAAAAAAAASASRLSESAELELSVSETNALRETLGLPPLRGGSSSASKSNAVYAVPQQPDLQAQERLEKAQLQRQVNHGIAAFVKEEGEGEADRNDIASWAMAMKTKSSIASSSISSSNQTLITPRTTNPIYAEQDLAGLHVAHAASELAEGSTTVMTFGDASILQTADDTSRKVLGLNEHGEQLENVDLMDQRKVSQGLKAKRNMELGMGRAGGYAGFDDDEFEELGGALAPSRLARGLNGHANAAAQATTSNGFRIGRAAADDEQEPHDLLALHRTVTSLEERNVNMATSDFMTAEEEDEMERAHNATKSKNKKIPKFKKQKGLSKRKDKKIKNQRRDESEDETETKSPAEFSGSSLLAELEENAVEHDVSVTRKRRRSDEEEEGEAAPTREARNGGQSSNVSRARFETIMAKANERSKIAFLGKPALVAIAAAADEEPDDEFLNAALAKARRLNRLQGLSRTGHTTLGADSVVAQLLSSSVAAAAVAPGAPSGAISFSVDETGEFSRALQARAEQSHRRLTARFDKNTGNAEPASADEGGLCLPADARDGDEDVEMIDLAKEMDDDEDKNNDTDLQDGTVSLGRGLGGILGVLKQSGDLARPNASREEMRGRSKDKKTYEDYQSLDLSQVVKIGKNATEQDREMARREIKLEYRDKNGRLLTRKEAFRELCYQFHGHGSGKRKEEQRSAQISREQSEATVAARQGSDGIFGALKATQKATGKAFVVHKT